MKNKFTIALLVLILPFISLINGYSAEKKEESIYQTLLKDIEKKKRVASDLSGTIYTNWHSEIKEEGDEQNTFEINRIYLTWKKQLDEVFSVKITTDIQKSDDSVVAPIYDQDGDADVDSDDSLTAEPNNRKYDVYIKFAYLQSEKKYKNVIFNAKFGMVPTPIIAFLDVMSDMGWAQSNFVNQGKMITPYDPTSAFTNTSGMGFDHGADLGFTFDIITKYVGINTAIVNGEGFKNVSEEDDNGKAYYGRFDLKPAPGLNIFAFSRFNVSTTADDTLADSGWKDNYDWLWGAGAGYKNEVISLGLYYFQPDQKDHGKITNTDGKEIKFQVIDSWFHLKFKKLTGSPLFLMGKIAMSRDANQDSGVNRVLYYGGGPGYAFSDLVRASAYYEYIKPNEGDSIQTFYLKAQFSY